MKSLIRFSIQENVVFDLVMMLNLTNPFALRSVLVQYGATSWYVEIGKGRGKNEVNDLSKLICPWLLTCTLITHTMHIIVHSKTTNISRGNNGISKKKRWWQVDHLTNTIPYTSECPSTAPQINELNDRNTCCMWMYKKIFVIIYI